MPANTYDGHALYQASSPLVRALPDYARQFQQHLARGEALLLLTQVHSHSQSLVAPRRKADAESRALGSVGACKHHLMVQCLVPLPWERHTESVSTALAACRAAAGLSARGPAADACAAGPLHR